MDIKDEKSTNVSQMFNEVLEVLRESSEVAEIKEPSDIDSITKQIETTMFELNQKAEQIYKATGMTREQLQSFAENPQNFTEKEWRLLTEVKKQIKEFQSRAEEIVEQGVELRIEKPKKETEKKGGKGGKGRVKKKDWMAG